MSCDDGLVMTVHPGVRRNHHPAHLRHVRRRTRATTSRSPWSSPTRCARCWSGTAPTRTSTWCCSPLDPDVFAREIAPLAGFYPSVYAGAPWWFLDSPATRSAGSRSRSREIAGFSRTVRLHRRHPRVLLDPGPARHVPAPGRRLPRRAGRRAPARRGRGPGDARPPWSPTSRARCSSCDRRARGDAAAARSAIVHLGPRRLLPGPPGLVHGRGRRRGGLGDRRLHRPVAAALADALNRQDGLYTLVVRGPDGDEMSRPAGGVPGPRRVRPDAWLRLSRRGRRSASSRSPSPRPATPRRATAGSTWTGRTCGPTSPRCADRGRRRHRAGPPRRGPRRAARRGRRTAGRRPLRQPARQRRRHRAASSPSCRGGRPGAGRLDRASTCPSSTTMVDRITPRTTADDVAAVAEQTGWQRPRARGHRALHASGC